MFFVFHFKNKLFLIVIYNYKMILGCPLKKQWKNLLEFQAKNLRYLKIDESGMRLFKISHLKLTTLKCKLSVSEYFQSYFYLLIKIRQQ